MGKSVEEQTAETLLQEAKRVEVDGTTYEVPAPTLGTLVMVSSVVSRMTVVGRGDNITMTALARSGDAPLVAEAIATIILGARAIKRGGRRWLPSLCGRRRLVRLTTRILESYTPADALRVLLRLLDGMQLGVFFELTTFLGGASVTRPTKVVETETATAATAPGRS